MSKQGHILIVEDEERWRELLSDTLEGAGFHVDTAATAAEARQKFLETLYHLFVFDIRLQNGDPANTEGMSLLNTLDAMGLGGAVEVIMLSGVGTKEQIREAFREYDVADFIAKEEFDNLEFLDLVQKVFSDRMRINLDLDIHWQDVSGPQEVVCNVKKSQQDVQDNAPFQNCMAAELNDLLCRLFYEANSLLVKPLAPGYSSAGVLWVQPSFDEGNGQAVIVKFGDCHKIDHEYRNFKEYVQSFVGGRRSTAAINLRRTPQLGGIIYSFLGAAGNQLEDFGTFYRRTKTAEVVAMLDHLFEDTCSTWYANSGPLQFCDLATEYQKTLNFTSAELEEVLTQKLTSVQGNDKLRFRLLNGNRSFINPIQAIANQSLVYSTYVCLTHGDFNGSNILIDQARQTWLIDFQHTSQGHILRDVTKLDAVVRFELLSTGEATLTERLELEEMLCNIKHFRELDQWTSNFLTTNPALAKAYNISMHLRKLTHKLIGRNRNATFDEYHAASLYQALNSIRFDSLSLLQREHALLSASLLAERLGL